MQKTWSMGCNWNFISEWYGMEQWKCREMTQGCSLHCPCRLWVNCSGYVDEYRKKQRINQINKDEIYEYYSAWGIDYSMPDYVMSG